MKMKDKNSAKNTAVNIGNALRDDTSASLHIEFGEIGGGGFRWQNRAARPRHV